MAWRPHSYLLEGELDNTQPGKVTGWMRFAGLPGLPHRVTFSLKGDFHRDIRGTKIRLRGEGRSKDAEAFMNGFAEEQTGNVGDITAGREPADYVRYPYIEWYSDQNGRVVLELDEDQVAVIGKPIPPSESEPVSREEQASNLSNFLTDMAGKIGAPKC
jgi:hypothetical protein